jgi:hypothetical protein
VGIARRDRWGIFPDREIEGPVSVLRAEEREDPVSRRCLRARLCQSGIRAKTEGFFAFCSREE